MRQALENIQLTLVTDSDGLTELAEWTPDGIVACDVETTGLQAFGIHADKIRLIQFGDQDRGFAIPYSDGAMHGAIQTTFDRFEGNLVGHNSRFDEAFLKQAGLDTGAQFDDSYILHHLSFPTDYHGLKSVAGAFYGREARAGEKWLNSVKRKNHWDWATVPIDHPAYWGYAAFDACLTARIWNDMEAGNDCPPPYYRELRVARLMAEVSERGMPVDMDYAQGLLDKWHNEASEIKEQLTAYQIEKPGSSAQIAAALQNDGWEPDVLTETGKPSVNRAVLEGMDHEVARLVLRWRRVTKWAKSYIEPMLASGGHLHANISSLRAATGRMSVDSPPLQQLPKGPEVRSCLLADEGTELWAIDHVGQEMRLLAAYAGDDDFTDTILNNGDLHGNIAAALYGPDYTPEQRGWAKNGVYGYAYGAAKARLAETTHTKAGEFEAAVAGTYPAIPQFMAGVIATGQRRLEEEGMAWARTAGGRMVAVPKSRIYALTNYLLQGSGADLIKQGLIRMDDAGLSDTVRLVVHDELLCAFPTGQGAEMAATAKGCLETEFRGVPFEASIKGPGRSWGETV